MNVVTLASRKGGAGKSTLTAHLAACAYAAGRRCLLIDADPQGSLTLWQSLRPDGQPPLQSAARMASCTTTHMVGAVSMNTHSKPSISA